MRPILRLAPLQKLLHSAIKLPDLYLSQRASSLPQVSPMFRLFVQRFCLVSFGGGQAGAPRVAVAVDHEPVVPLLVLLSQGHRCSSPVIRSRATHRPGFSGTRFSDQLEGSSDLGAGSAMLLTSPATGQDSAPVPPGKANSTSSSIPDRRSVVLHSSALFVGLPWLE